MSFAPDTSRHRRLALHRKPVRSVCPTLVIFFRAVPRKRHGNLSDSCGKGNLTPRNAAGSLTDHTHALRCRVENLKRKTRRHEWHRVIGLNWGVRSKTSAPRM